MPEFLNPLKDFVDSNFLVALILAIVIAVLMLVFLVAMLVNFFKLASAKKATENFSALAGGDSTELETLQAKIAEVEKQEADATRQLKYLQEKIANAERELKEFELLQADHHRLQSEHDATKKQLRFYEEKLDEIRNREDVLRKDAEKLQKENAKLKEQTAKTDAPLTLEEAIDQSVFDDDAPKKSKKTKSAAAPGSAAKSAVKIAPAPKAAPQKEPAAKDTPKDADDTGIYSVTYDQEKGDWVVKKRGAERATRRLRTKEEAVTFAKDLANNQNAVLAIHKKDGKFQKH